MLGVGLYVSVGVSFLIGIFRAPSVALAALFCMFGFEQWAQSVSPYFTLHSEVTNILVGVFIILGIIVLVVSKRRLMVAYPTVGYAVIFLFLYALASVIWAPRPDISVQLWMRNAPYFIVFIGLAPFLIEGSQSLRNAMFGILVFGGVVVALVLMLSEWQGRFIVLQGLSGYTGSSMYVGGNPLAMAQMAGYVALSALLLDVKRMRVLQWTLRSALVVCCLIIVVKSGSRGQFFGLVGVATLFGFFKLYRGEMHQMVGALFLSSIFIIICGWVLLEYAEATRWSVDELGRQGQGRFGMSIVLLEYWYSNPMTMLFGLGNSASYDPEIIGIYPHQVPVEILCEEGVLGFLVYLFIIVFTIRSLKKLFEIAGSDPGKRGLVALLGAMFFFNFVLTLKQGSLLTHYDFFALVIIITRYELLVNKKRSSANDLLGAQPASHLQGAKRILAIRKGGV